MRWLVLEARQGWHSVWIIELLPRFWTMSVVEKALAVKAAVVSTNKKPFAVRVVARLAISWTCLCQVWSMIVPRIDDASWPSAFSSFIIFGLWCVTYTYKWEPGYSRLHSRSNQSITRHVRIRTYFGGLRKDSVTCVLLPSWSQSSSSLCNTTTSNGEGRWPVISRYQWHHHQLEQEEYEHELHQRLRRAQRSLLQRKYHETISICSNYFQSFQQHNC